MKPTLDTLQILLALPWPYALATSVLLAVLILQAIKLAREAFSLFWAALLWLRSLLLRRTKGNAFLVAFAGLLLFSFRASVHDALQEVEVNYLSPVYIDAADTSAWALSKYEAHMEKQLSEREADIVKRHTRELAARLGCSPLAIYEVAYSECSLNPFTIRKDGIAAGWIQFTAAGLSGLGVSLDEVKAACRRRDTEYIMGLTDRYMTRAAQGLPLPTSTEVYMAIFAPAKLSQPGNPVLYQGRNNPAYYLNEGLDGYAPIAQPMADGRTRIHWVRRPDGAITKEDMRLLLAAKRHKFLNL